MTTSGTTAWSLDVYQITELAGRRARPSNSGPMTGEDARRARENLALIQIDISNRGYPLSLFTLKTLTLVAGTTDYTLPTDVSDIYDAVYRTVDSAGNVTDIPLERISIFNYNGISVKDTAGKPSIFALQRGRDGTTLSLFPTPDAAQSIKYWAVVKPSDITAAQQSTDFNYRWFPCLVAGLAHYMAMERDDVAPEKVRALQEEYEFQLTNALMEDRERTSTFLIPGGRR